MELIGVQKQLNVCRLAEINAKMMLKFVSNTSAVGVKILLAVGDCARRKGRPKCIKF